MNEIAILMLYVGFMVGLITGAVSFTYLAVSLLK